MSTCVYAHKCVQIGVYMHVGVSCECVQTNRHVVLCVVLVHVCVLVCVLCALMCACMPASSQGDASLHKQ